MECSIKVLESLKCLKPVLSLLLIKNWYFASYGTLAYKYILSISGRWLVKLNNEFVFPDPEPPSYKYSVWVFRNFWPIWIMFFYVFFCNIIKVDHFLYHLIILLHLISSFLLARSLLVLYAYVSSELIDCILLSSF